MGTCGYVVFYVCVCVCVFSGKGVLGVGALLVLRSQDKIIPLMHIYLMLIGVRG